MTGRALRFALVSLGLAVATLAPLACGGGKQAATDGGPSPDGSSSQGDGATCAGTAISCVEGGLLGTGVWCAGLAIPGTCVDGRWTCPPMWIDKRDCNCGEPGLSCAGEMCTPQGWVCPDAGVDGDASGDGSEDATDAGLDGDASASD
jgi:hypothetical protein